MRLPIRLIIEETKKESYMRADLIGEIGINIIDPYTQYLASEKERQKAKRYLATEYPGIEITDEVLEIFIQDEERAVIMGKSSDPELHYPHYANYLQDAQDKFEYMVDCGYGYGNEHLPFI
jgi:hypothetical protein